MVKHYNNHYGKKFLLIGLVIIGAIFVSYVVLQRLDKVNNTDQKDFDPLTGESINYDPPTSEEISAEDQYENQISDSKPEKDNENKNIVYPLISTWTQDRDNKNLLINGFIPSVVESGGKCMLELEKDGIKVTQSKDARPDAQTTTCGIIEISRDSLSAGTWIATLVYSSNNSYGKSETVGLDIK